MAMDGEWLIGTVRWAWSAVARVWSTGVGAREWGVQRAVDVPLNVLCLSFAWSLLMGCSAAQRCRPEEPRVASRVDGVPETIWAESAQLIDLEPRRHCQVLFEGSFTTHHAVWFTFEPSGAAKVSVTMNTRSGREHLTADLDQRTARVMQSACRAFLTSAAPRCARLGRDGVTYYAADHIDESGYAMRAFWSPLRRTPEETFVRLAEALRDYAVAPRGLASVYVMRIHDLASELDCALGPEKHSWCKHL